MKWTKYLLGVIFLALINVAFAAVQYNPEDADQHPEKQVEKNKSTINVKNKGGNLFISGDVRAKWNKRKLSAPNATNAGFGTGYGVPDNFYEAKTNLLFNYDADFSWAEIKIEFKTPMGLVSGSPTTVKLRRAFVGYDLLHTGPHELYVEVGRQQLDYLVDSNVQFDSNFDGGWIGYDYNMETVGDFFAHGGVGIINTSNAQYFWLGEAGLTQIAQTGLYTKYSYVHWRKKGYSGFGDGSGFNDNPNYRFNNSQVTLGYVFMPNLFSFPTRLFSGFVYNHAAKASDASANKKRNKAWYVGMELGQLEKAGDWVLNICYQSVGLNAVPQFDVSGVGRGFTSDSSATDIQQDPFNPANFPGKSTAEIYGQDASTVEGQTNYKGVDVVGTYNITSNFALKCEYATSWQLRKVIGGTSHYQNFELGFIYSF